MGQKRMPILCMLTVKKYSTGLMVIHTAFKKNFFSFLSMLAIQAP
jgi:hypothetical protein